MENFQISKSFIDNLSNNEDLKLKFINNPEKVLMENSDKNPLQWDKWIYRSVVWALAAAIILCVIFAFYLALETKDKPMETPQILIAIGSASIGALAGLLAPSPKDKT